MKKLRFILVLGLVLAFSTPQVAYANMAAPKEADVGSSITFEQNDTVSVLSERLDITVQGSEADLAATYTMKNTTKEAISTQTMFLSPNMKSSGVAVTVKGSDTSFAAESYALNYSTEITAKDWRYAVLTDEGIASRDAEQTVDAITFQLDFAPSEEYEVTVSYRYRLGGYPDYDFNAKIGRIEYYLAPAALWNDFGGLTINLKLDEDMPVIVSSSLAFEKMEARTYRYASATLPEGNLEIVIDESWWQNIFSTLRSPYFFMTGLLAAPLIFIAVIAGIWLVWRLRKKKKPNQ